MVKDGDRRHKIVFSTNRNSSIVNVDKESSVYGVSKFRDETTRLRFISPRQQTAPRLDPQ